MQDHTKNVVKNSVGRAAFVGLSLLLQIGWLWFLAWKVEQYSDYLSWIIRLLALLVALRVYGKREKNAAVKITWIVVLLAIPVFGLSLYLLLKVSEATGRLKTQFTQVHQSLEGALDQDEAVMDRLEAADYAIANQARYTWKFGPYPIYQNTDVTFYPQADLGLAAQKEALREAKRFIFMEYHAIENTSSFHEVEDILVEKARQGVEVRLFYDDMGSIGFLSREFIREMEAKGIQCRVFNPLMPIPNIFMNNRDHRKITVIDGYVGFTGGYNLADEYFNINSPYGHWKDTGVKLVGDGVRSLTVMFLEMWNTAQDTDANMGFYLQRTPYAAKEAGFVQPYGDAPLDNEQVGENVYMNMIKNAKHTCFIMTPYLILDDEMNLELNLAAKRGVDVRIITPGIPDKKIVYKLTRSYYAGLARNGVRIYEYTPGFSHGKQVVCDSEVAVVGTINFDYRSLYLHFENGVFLYRCGAVQAVEQDFWDTFPLCREVTERYSGKRSAPLRIGQCLLRLLAPLM